jgi:hypothetical protein
MPRRLLHVLTILSAVICVGSLLLVVRSFIRMDTVGFPTGTTSACGVFSLDGQVNLWHERDDDGGSYAFFHSSKPASVSRRFFSDELWSGDSRITGIRWLGIGWGNVDGSKFLVLPLWLLPLLTAILPVRWWRGRRLHTRGFTVVETPAEKT